MSDLIDRQAACNTRETAIITEAEGQEVLYKDKTGKLVEIVKGTRFLARDRHGRIFEYIDTGGMDGYEKLLKNLTNKEKEETRVVRSWFLERYIEILSAGGAEQ